MSNMTITAKTTLHHARALQIELRAKGHEVTLAEAFLICRIGQQAAREARAEIARQDRAERVRTGMVAAAVNDQRAVGAFDGE